MLKTAFIFGDNMVLQQGKRIPVWGNAEPGRTVTAEFMGDTGSAVTDSDGNWYLELPAQNPEMNQTLRVSSDSEIIEYQNVCVGEVWLAGGQSNMEFMLGFEQHFEDVLAEEPDGLIRFFDYPEVSYEGQMEDFSYRNHGFWRSWTGDDLPWFSAVGFYFARKLRKQLGVPVGIVGCNWGGTPASAWMAPEYLQGTSGDCWLRDYAETLRTLDIPAYQEGFRHDPANDRTNLLADEWYRRLMKDGLARQDQLDLMAASPVPPLVVGTYSERRPGGLYEMMLKKVHPFAIKGVIWYQGETDGDFHPDVYTVVFTQMIRCWRDLWKEEFPFLFTQLAPFGQWMTCDGTNYPIVRSCQEQVSKTVPKTWMASIGDVGMEWDIHPKNKKAVGNRLALLALGHVYGEDILCDAPRFLSAEKRGDTVRIQFSNAEGLHIQGGHLNGFIGTTAAGTALPITEARIEEDSLILICGESIRKLQYGIMPFYTANLFNRAGIPVLPFDIIL